MGRYRENLSTLLTKLAYCLGRKERRSPVPQTSLSTTSHINPSDRMLTYSI